MIIATPHVIDLEISPELAILATLEATLAITIAAIAAANPALGADDRADVHYTTDVDNVAVLTGQAHELIATINRYRLALVDPQAWDF